jgi:hypothetical protein
MQLDKERMEEGNKGIKKKRIWNKGSEGKGKLAPSAYLIKRHVMTYVGAEV